MMRERIWRWMFRLTSCALLATSGCPDRDDVKDLAAGSIEGFLSGLISIAIEGLVDTAFGQ
ncbi:MAG: hypothetical protein JXA69_08005 [Phycisphaerae bacterium]|nr:hypothetical protein [Phycisphaerae bacterium]